MPFELPFDPDELEDMEAAVDAAEESPQPPEEQPGEDVGREKKLVSRLPRQG